MYLVALIIHRLAEALDDALAQLVETVPADRSADDHHELIAAQATDQVLAAGVLTQAVGHFLEHRVAGSMAEAVIDLLEAVQVQTEQRQWLGCGQVLVEVRLELGAVGEPRQRVMQRQVFDLALLANPLGDVAGGAPVTDAEAVEHDRSGGQLSDPLIAQLVGIATTQDPGIPGLQPVAQGLSLAIENVAQRAPQPVGYPVVGNGLETAGQVHQPQLIIGFPEPVGGGFGNVAKALLA